MLGPAGYRAGRMPSNRHSPSAGYRARLRATGVGGCRLAGWRGSRSSPTSRSGSEISDPGVSLAGAVWLGRLWAASAVAAAKDDVLHLKNGDRITCEIRNRDRSVLTISTDALGNATVHWGEVAELTSPRQFDVQLSDGAHHLGSLA